MVKRAMYYEIKRLQKQGYGINRIKRELGIDKKTVRKYLKMDEAEYRQYHITMQDREKEFDALQDEIISLYKENDFLKLPAAAIYDYLEEKHGKLPANENSLRNYIRYLVLTGRLTLNERKRYYTKVADLPYGKQLQIDFGEKKNRRGGKYYIFAAVLSTSRFKYSALRERPFTAMDLILHLLDCFDYLGGIPQELVIDQDSVMVVDENAGEILYTREFGDFIHEMALSMRVCRKSDPESKGKIENFVKYIKYNFFALREFDTVIEANDSLLKWLERRANGKISQATKKIPGIEIVEERKYLKPLKNSIYRKDQTSAREERTVNDKCRITVDSCQYDIPEKYRNRTVEIYKTSERLFVFDPYSGTEIADYRLSLIPGQIIKNKAITREMGVTTRALKGEVMGYFVLESWREFLEANFSTFNRYVRDQCLEVRKYFKKQEVDIEMLDKAVRYCIENKTFSIANLNDSYQHFLKERRISAENGLSEPVLMVCNGVIRAANVEVAKPDTRPYQALFETAGGGQ